MKCCVKKMAIASAIITGGIFTDNAIAAETIVNLGSFTVTEGTYTVYKYWGVDTVTALPTLQIQPWWADGGFLSWTSAQNTLSSNIYNAISSTFEAGKTAILAYSVSTSTPTQYFVSFNGGVSFGNYSGTQVPINDGWFLDGTYYWVLVTLLTPLGPTPEDTLVSMQPNASAMKNAFNGQYAALAYGLNHDCTIYDVNNLCISAFGRNTSLNDSSYDTSAAGVVLGYKPHPQFRIGTYLDQSFNNNTTAGVNVERSNPDVGLFGVWNMNTDGTGLELRAAANYGKRDLTVTRSAVGDTSAEAGRGKSDLNAYGALLEASYAMPMNDTWMAKPYAGVRYLSIKRDGYTEALTDDVQNPLTYSKLKQETTSAIVGVRLNGQVAPKVIASFNAGLEHDLHHSINDYRATGVDDLAAINMDSQKHRTRPTVGAALSYDVADKQRITASVQYRKEIFMSESSATGQVNYTIGF